MNSAGYGGSAQRGYEAPACVQNAMVTKDKKPFTYTPGGIDLSQIKSERMAKRLARNAQAEGATGASQQNRPTQPQSPGSGGNAASQIGAAGMGMPFQVLPPPPPPAPIGVAGYKKPTTITQQPELNYNSNNSTQQQQYTPPQPTYSPSYQPLQQQQQQQPQYNNITPPLSVATPSQPQPQQQQQSPRPEFRSVAPPQSPSVHVYTRQTDSPRAESGTPPQRATDSPFRYGGPQPLQQQQQQPPQQLRAPPAISPLAQQQPTKLYTSSPTGAGAPAQPTTANNSPNSQPAAQTVPWRTQRTPTQQQQPQSQPQTTAIYNNVSPQQQQQTQPASAYQGPKPSNVGSLYIAPLAAPTEPQAPNVVRQFQQQQQQQQARESPIRQIPQQQQTSQQQQAQPLRSTVPWLSTKPKANDQPEWARPEENGNVVPSSLNRIKSPPPPQSQQQQQQQVYYQQPQQQQQPQPQLYGYQPEQGNGFAVAAPTNFGSHGIGSTGLRLQINANPIVNNAATQQTGPRERIIPIQLEQTPTNTTSQQPNFNVSYGGITTAPSSYVVRSPNQFVDQGYNNFPSSAGANQQPSAQRVMSPTQQLNAPRIVQQQQQYTNNNNGAGGGANRSRVIPIAMEGEGTRGPISPSPIVLQNDPRSSPIQSKSFRILQKITDTIDDGSGDDRKAESHVDVEPQLQRPQYARQMSAQQARQQPNVEQMRRMQIAAEPQQQQQQQQSQAPQAWNQGNAFKSSQQHTIYNNNNDMPQPYIHPSEQQVPEPKKYTGSAIPSRSFKILQAMTTPENAGPGQSDL